MEPEVFDDEEWGYLKQAVVDTLNDEPNPLTQALLDQAIALRKQRDTLLQFKNNVDWALNSGDGSYRP